MKDAELVMKAYGEVKAELHSRLTCALVGAGWEKFKHQQSYHGVKNPSIC